MRLSLSKSCFRQSNALDKSVKIMPIVLPFSSWFHRGNAQHDKIQYRIERENQDKVLEFLDIKVIYNETGKYEFNIFRMKAISNVQVQPESESSHDPRIIGGIFKGFVPLYIINVQ